MLLRVVPRVVGTSLCVLGLVIMVGGPASAGAAPPQVYYGEHGEFWYACSYHLTLPNRAVDSVEVALSATAQVTPYDGVNKPPVTTSVDCYLSHGSGGVANTMPGSVVASAGTASFQPSRGLPNVCFSASAFFIGGEWEYTPTTCIRIDEDVVRAGTGAILPASP